jgi:glutamate-1-semialdehyde 2,1-aminomutase
MGIGGTLSGNALAINALRATLKHAATQTAFEKMIAGANRMADGLEASIEKYDLPWSVTRCGARAELQFVPRLPTCGSEAKAAFDWPMIYYTHLFLANRGLLITPFHNMMLVPPMATEEDIDCLVKGWDACMQELSVLSGRNRSH